jgi:hypothetical protein
MPCWLWNTLPVASFLLPAASRKIGRWLRPQALTICLLLTSVSVRIVRKTTVGQFATVHA